MCQASSAFIILILPCLPPASSFLLLKTFFFLMLRFAVLGTELGSLTYALPLSYIPSLPLTLLIQGLNTVTRLVLNSPCSGLRPQPTSSGAYRPACSSGLLSLTFALSGSCVYETLKTFEPLHPCLAFCSLAAKEDI